MLMMTRSIRPRGGGRSFVVAFASALLFTGRSEAAGIALDVQSGRGVGMASAVTAIVDDSSGIFYNPAGIAQGRILDAQVGDTLILPFFRYTSPGGTGVGNDFQGIPPFQAYEAGGLTDSLSIGIGVFTPFGLTVAWPAGWVGRSIVVESMLATYDFNPTVAYRLGPLRLGAGLQLVRATVDLKRKIETGIGEASTELGAGTWGVGANFGAQLEVIPRYLSLGVHYRSAVTFRFDGEAHFDDVPAPFQSALHDQRAQTRFVTPDVLQMAVASRPISNVVLDAELVWYGWAKFRSIDLTFPNDATGSLSSSQPKNWSNSVNARLGGEVKLDESWQVRAGVLYDPSPSPGYTLTPDVPDAGRLNLALGGSYLHPSGFRVDLGYQFLVLFKATSTAVRMPGDYSGNVNIVGISVGYRTPNPRPVPGAT
jgi:long-chain fatty acid transport protein